MNHTQITFADAYTSYSIVTAPIVKSIPDNFRVDGFMMDMNRKDCKSNYYTLYINTDSFPYKFLAISSPSEY